VNDQHLLNIAQAGLELEPRGIWEDEAQMLLIVLLDIEDVLDKGRGLVTDADARREVNARMDKLRRRIRTMLDGMDSTQAKALLEQRGRMLTYQFEIKDRD